LSAVTGLLAVVLFRFGRVAELVVAVPDLVI